MKLVTLTMSATLIIALALHSSAHAAPQPSITPAPPTGNAPTSQPDSTTAENCVTDEKDVKEELKSGRWPAGPLILNPTYFLQAGNTTDVILNKPFAEGTHYFGYIERYDDDKVHAFLGRGLVSATRISENHQLVKGGRAEKSDTLLSLRLPDSIADLWKRANLYIYTCAGSSPDKVSRLTAHVSPLRYSALLVWVAVVILYAIAALAAKAADTKSAHWFRYFDPVTMTAGPDGRGSLSKLQILFFSMIVFGLTAYIVLRTGVLSDLSPTILLLLGIAGVGATAAKGADARRNRIDLDNWAWFIRKGWLPEGGLAELNRASWNDIFASEGEFDVYRYQSFIFSLAVGGALVVAGISQLASFEIPDTVLGILGLSQAVYIGGKLVAPTSIADLNDATKELRELEKKFAAAALSQPDPNPAAGGDALTIAKRRAGQAYDDYITKARVVRIQFQSVTGRQITDSAIEPLPS